MASPASLTCPACQLSLASTASPAQQASPASTAQPTIRSPQPLEWGPAAGGVALKIRCTAKG